MKPSDASWTEPSSSQPQSAQSQSSQSQSAQSHWASSAGSEPRWAELIELYEYKVGDLIAGRSPRGGKRSLGDLRSVLTDAPLEGALLRRFGQTDRIWRTHLRTLAANKAAQARSHSGNGHGSGADDQQATPAPTVRPSGSASWNEPILGSTFLAGGLPGNEQDALEQLRFALWREGVRLGARTQTQLWLRESDLVTLRCAYALSVNLERGETSMPVPHSRDPLASLGTPSVAEYVVEGLADQVCAAFTDPGAPYPGARQQALTRLLEAVTQMSLNPFPRHPDQDVLQARVQAAERELLGPDLTRTLIEGLQAEIGAPRPAQERIMIREAARKLTDFIEGIIPVSEGGHGPELPPLPRVLYAATSRFDLPAPDEGSSTLTIRLSGDTQTHWRAQPIRWKRAGEGWLVAIGPLEYRLTSRARTGLPDPDATSITVTLGDVSAQALLHGDYLHLSARQNDKGLLELLALARAVSLLLDPGGAYLNLRLARAAAQKFRDGRIDEGGVGVLSAERYSAASPDALLTFARKGVEGLLGRVRQRSLQETEHVFQAAAEALGADEGYEQHLLKLLRRVLQPDARPEAHPSSAPRHVTELAHVRVGGPGQLVVLEFAGEPLSIEVMSRVVTLRLDYKGDLAVILPGAPAAILRELLVIDVAAGGILLVRQGGRILVSYQPHVRV